MISEALNGITVSNRYTDLTLRTNVALLTNSTAAFNAGSRYDAASRLLSVTFGTNKTGYTYLTNSPLVETLGFTNGSTLRLTVSNRYDNLNRLTAKDSRTNGASLARFNYAYNTANQRTGITNVDSSYWVYTYDNLGQVISGKRYWSDGVIVAGQQFGYNFDDIGNRRHAKTGGDTNGANLRQEDYTANNLNQYTARTVPGHIEVQGSAATNATVTVNGQATVRHEEYFRGEPYFDNTNAALWASITNTAVIGEVITNWTTALLVLKTPQSFSYDADGNLTNDGRFEWTWDGENRLTALDSLTNSTPSNAWLKARFGYDHQGRRTSKVVSNWTAGAWSNALTLRFVYDGWNLLAEYDNTNSAHPVLLRSYAWGPDLSGTPQGAGGVGGLLAITDHTGVIGGVTSTHFVCYDGNGNIVALVNAADGTITAQYDYGPFGTLIRATGPMAFVNPFRFSTKYQDDETGLVYYGYRYYNPVIGSWVSRDPVQEAGGPNQYAFVANNPVFFVDRLGLLLIVLPPGVEPPVGFRACGYSIFKSGRKEMYWCKDDPSKPTPPPPSDPKPDPLDPYGCWQETNPHHLPNIGPGKGIGCLARKTGCLECCERKFPINGGSTEEWAKCLATCEDKFKRCSAFQCTTPRPDFPKPWSTKF